MYKKLIFIFFFGSVVISNAQNIRMDFPHFAGKAYDFIIFQGDNQKTIYQGVIPSDGKFTLTVPKEYTPYTGMSRWLITGTKEGGGLDMLIPGKDFSVSCKETRPDEKNIIYTGNIQIEELNNLYQEQQKILEQCYAMLQALKTFQKTNENYVVFEKEYQKQVKNYEKFQNTLQNNADYTTQFIRILNITQGIGTQILDTEEKKARNIAQYIADDLDWQALYTSGHWAEIVSSWISIHTQVLKDPSVFVNDFAKISNKIKDSKLYIDFVGRTAYFLAQQGKDGLINAVAPLVITSGKITNYEGSLAVYTKGAVGTQAPNLIFTGQQGNKDAKILKSNDLAGTDYNKTLLMFYESGCGPCENLLQEIPERYESIKSKGVHIISISADEDEKIFKNKAKDFLWKDTYCDYEGFKGVNFKNYGIAGTPTVFLIDRNGKILLRTAILEEVLSHLKEN
jgi:peroxiredoxin